VAPSVLLPSTRGTFLKGNQSLKSVVQIIDETLSDHDKLLARTQVTRVKRARIGASEEENAGEGVTLDPEVFDDTDFYQRMLRDIIDARGNGSKTEDWMLLQKQKKAKKKVDTKASKGRKLRFVILTQPQTLLFSLTFDVSYEVHEKLQNFMVPVPVPGAWHDEQVDELFASLLGKGFENIGIADPEPVASVSLTGFRVFG
jgi:protein AATF/BFR2